MKVIALEIPGDLEALPGWLERQMVGLDLAALAAELEAVHGPEPSSAARESLDTLLGGFRGRVLERGLTALPPETLRRLLRRPRLLLELQGLALSSGASYWRRLADSSYDLRAPVERGRRNLAAIAPPAASSSRKDRVQRSAVHPISRRRRPWVVTLAAAATVLAAVCTFEGSRSRVGDRVEVASLPKDWGWSRPGTLPEDLPPAAYLNRLADAAEDWFKKRPEEPIAVARRVAEFRQGCSVLILAKHRPLSVEDRTWLVEKCRAWAARLDRRLAEIEAGEDPLQVRARADETIRKLIRSLRERARAVA